MSTTLTVQSAYNSQRVLEPVTYNGEIVTSGGETLWEESDLNLTQEHSIAVQGAYHENIGENVDQVFILTVSNAVNLHDAWTVTLDPQGPYDLVVSSPYHVHVAESANLNTTDLVIADAYHDHVAWNVTITESKYLDIDSPYHALASDQIIPIFGNISCCETYGLNIPVLEIEATMTGGASADADLPTIRLTSARMGARCGTLNLPDLECSGEMSVGATSSLDKRLPSLSLESYTGARTGTLNLPSLEVEIAISGERLGFLDKRLPVFTLDADGTTPVLATLDKSLPPLAIAAEGSVAGTGDLSKNLPAFKISAKVLSGAYGTLDADLPGIILSDESIAGDSLSLDGYLPTIVSGAIMGELSTIIYEDRYDDYVLRYAR